MDRGGAHDLFREVGLQPGAKWFIAEGADAARMNRSIPLEKAWDDALIAYGQNGEALRPEQGYPMRLLLPGWEGNTNIKWLHVIKVTDKPYQTRQETARYTDLICHDGACQARQFTFVMDAKSVITAPSAKLPLQRGFVEIRGLAWSGRGKIVHVEVSTDGGKSWGLAALQDPILPKALTVFRFPWQWEGQETILQSRCTDETGYIQPTRAALVGVRRRRLVISLQRHSELESGQRWEYPQCPCVAVWCTMVGVIGGHRWLAASVAWAGAGPGYQRAVWLWQRAQRGGDQSEGYCCRARWARACRQAAARGDAGEQVYKAKCIACHGPTGTEGPMDKLVGEKLPVKTIGSFWPYATTVFDYIRRAQPFNQPGSLTDEEVYAVTAWLLFRNNIIAADQVIDAITLPKVRMPNRDGFVPDPRPDAD